MSKGRKNKSASNKRNKKSSEQKEAATPGETSAAAEALRNQDSQTSNSSKSKSNASKSKSNSRVNDTSEERTDPPQVKLLTELNSDELKKKCVKLKLIDVGEKVKKEVCLIKMTEFLAKRGLSSIGFKFAPNGQTEFPSVLFEKSPADSNAESDNDTDALSVSSDSTDSDDEDSDDDAPVRKNRRKVTLQDKQSKRAKSRSNSVFGGGQVPDGWYIMPHPRTGEPVGMFRESDGKLLELRDPAVSNPAPMTSLRHNRTDTNTDTVRQISQAAAMLGASGISSRENDPSQVREERFSNYVRSMDNVEFCNAIIPSFVFNQEKDKNGSRKLVSGMYTTGKKEVLQKEIYPHHLVDSLINPAGVEYQYMNIQELNNGFTAMILAKCGNDTNKEVVNMLKHLNRLNAYLMFAPLSAVLDFNGGFMQGLENKTQSWTNGAKMMEYHDRHLHSLKLSSSRVENNQKKNDKSNGDKTDKDDNQKSTEKKPKCTKDWVLKKGMCFNYQNDQCDQQNGHDDGNGKAQVHCCAWCSYCDRGYLLHNNTTCEDRKNPFRKTRPQSGQ